MTIDVDNSSSNLRFDPFPAQESIAFTYSSDGLMQTMTDARQHTHQFSFDSLGQLTQDSDSAGGFTHLDRADLADGYQITNSTATSHLSTYRIENLPTGDQLRINTGTDGSRTTNIIGADALTSTLSPDGSMSSVLQGLDPRWGMQAPLANSITNRLPSGLTAILASDRTVSLASPDDPMSLTNQTDTVSINGHTFTSIYNFDGVNRSAASISPLGRTFSAALDAKGRVTQASVPGIAPVSFQHDNHGRLQAVSQTADGQARTLTYTYDSSQNGGPSSGRLTGITDALNRTTSFAYDPNGSGRVVQETFSNGRFIQFQYDPNGNMTGITPPAKPTHLFDFNSVDLLDQYTPPLADNTGNNFTTYEYNLDRQLTKITRPDGQLIQDVYDPQIGRLDHISLPFNEQISYAYNGPGCGCSGVGRPSDVTFSAVDWRHRGPAQQRV